MVCLFFSPAEARTTSGTKAHRCCRENRDPAAGGGVNYELQRLSKAGTGMEGALVPFDRVSQNVSSLIAYTQSDELYDATIFSSFLDELRTMAWSIVDFTVSMFMVLVYAIVVLIKVILYNLPLIARVSQRVVDFHRTQLTATDLAVEAFLLVTIGLFMAYRTALTDTWVRVQTILESRGLKVLSRTAGSFLYFGSSLWFSIYGRNFLNPLAAPMVLPLFTLLMPAVSSIFFLLEHPSMSDGEGQYGAMLYDVPLSRLRAQLKPLLLLLCYHGCATLLAAISLFPSRFIAFAPSLMAWARRFMLILLVWGQVSSSGAAHLYDTTAPLAQELSRQMPVPVLTSPMVTAASSRSAARGTRTAAKRSVQARTAADRDAAHPLLHDASHLASAWTATVLYMLKSSRLLSSQQEEWLIGLTQDGVLLLIFLLSCCLPSFLAIFGVVAVGFIVPITKTAQLHTALTALEEQESAARAMPRGRRRRSISSDGGGGDGATPGSPPVSSSAFESTDWVTSVVGLFSPRRPAAESADADSQEERCWRRGFLVGEVRRWLAYWAFWAMVWAMRTGSLAAGGRGAWVSLLLLASMVLQHSYVRGAERLMARVLGLLASTGARDVLLWTRAARGTRGGTGITRRAFWTREVPAAVRGAWTWVTECRRHGERRGHTHVGEREREREREQGKGMATPVTGRSSRRRTPSSIVASTRTCDEDDNDDDDDNHEEEYVLVEKHDRDLSTPSSSGLRTRRSARKRG